MKHLLNVEAKKFCVIAQIAARLHRRWHHRKIIFLQRLQILNTNARCFEHFFERETLFLALCLESLTDGLRHD